MAISAAKKARAHKWLVVGNDTYIQNVGVILHSDWTENQVKDWARNNARHVTVTIRQETDAERDERIQKEKEGSA